jgi:hypothetical protein
VRYKPRTLTQEYSMKVLSALLIGLSIASASAATCTLKVRSTLMYKDYFTPKMERILAEKGYVVREDGDYELYLQARQPYLCSQSTFMDGFMAGYSISMTLKKAGAPWSETLWESRQSRQITPFSETRAKRRLHKVLRQLPDCEII